MEMENFAIANTISFPAAWFSELFIRNEMKFSFSLKNPEPWIYKNLDIHLQLPACRTTNHPPRLTWTIFIAKKQNENQAGQQTANLTPTPPQSNRSKVMLLLLLAKNKSLHQRGIEAFMQNVRLVKFGFRQKKKRKLKKKTRRWGTDEAPMLLPFFVFGLFTSANFQSNISQIYSITFGNNFGNPIHQLFMFFVEELLNFYT